MTSIIFLTFISISAVSLISLIGVASLFFNWKKIEKSLIFLISLSAGTLLGDAFFHLIPSSYEELTENTLQIPLFLLSGILVFFVLEKFIHWRHCHEIASENHPHPFSYIILLGDGLHNLIDGAVLAAGFLVSFPVGLATTLAVIMHEIPQEIGDFGSLIYGGFSRKKALALNFLTALTSFMGAGIALALNSALPHVNQFLIPFAAGGFIYIASVDLIPELHKNAEIKKSAGQFLALLTGIGLMIGLVFLE
ncbi:MAG: ZIP family metal transporter [Candidatus Moranbacteria bacterium CG_4_9_14_3_um_filter_40_7]|nr:ZIP family metal transporter [bacterium]PIP26769.1 MAG: ZIP family metal transporter [Candidatus Moranbacteria bacterium CG23_combo_of_CG06-09_8_20_14_all_40_16]PIU80607.1 MAG: ZIP family metal transporter [Candidatus Moranbacteria bacterium CG06_land_8_20_14_3_00_40_12]PJA87702.1 MAG: ZIP family metal transporter [Candidatus Moranbacteria bacterium CG_4_9_14_3_um_filter_40_7]